MASLNKVMLIGNLTRDPEVKYTQGGTAVCEIGIAVNRTYTASDGQQKKDTCFIEVNIWGHQAENCKRYLQKGSLVFIEGRLQMDSWDDKNTGEKRTRMRVVAERIQFLSPKSAGSAEFDGNSYPVENQAPQQQGGYNQQYQKNTANRPPQQQSRNAGQQAANRPPQAPYQKGNQTFQQPPPVSEQIRDKNELPEPPEPPPDAFVEDDEIESIPF